MRSARVCTTLCRCAHVISATYSNSSDYCARIHCALGGTHPHTHRHSHCMHASVFVHEAVHCTVLWSKCKLARLHVYVSMGVSAHVSVCVYACGDMPALRCDPNIVRSSGVPVLCDPISETDVLPPPLVAARLVLVFVLETTAKSVRRARTSTQRYHSS